MFIDEINDPVSRKIYGALSRIISDTGADEDALEPNVRLFDLGLDSLDLIEITLSLEDEFAIDLYPEGLEDTLPEDLSTWKLSDLHDVVMKHAIHDRSAPNDMNQ